MAFYWYAIQLIIVAIGLPFVAGLWGIIGSGAAIALAVALLRRSRKILLRMSGDELVISNFWSTQKLNTSDIHHCQFAKEALPGIRAPLVIVLNSGARVVVRSIWRAAPLYDLKDWPTGMDEPERRLAAFFAKGEIPWEVAGTLWR